MFTNTVIQYRIIICTHLYAYTYKHNSLILKMIPKMTKKKKNYSGGRTYVFFFNIAKIFTFFS